MYTCDFRITGYVEDMGLSSETLAQRIKQAIEAADLTQREVAERVGMETTALSKALSGLRNFKPLELARIADVINVPVQDLLADEDAPQQPVLAAARTQAASSVAVESAKARVQVMLDLDRLLVEADIPNRLRLPHRELGRGAAHKQGSQLAQQLRDEVGLGDQDLPADFRELQELIEEKYGVDVAIEDLPKGLDGLSVARGHFNLIMVSSAIAPTRQRFTLAHELGHLAAADTQNILIDEDILGVHTDAETRANAFAAAFLIPPAPLRERLRQRRLNEAAVAELLAIYQVSLDVLAFRAHNVGAVDYEGRDTIRRMDSELIVLRNGRRRSLDALNGRQSPGILLERALKAYVNGEISVRPIAGLLNTDSDTVLSELAPPPRELTANEDVMVP